MQHPLPPPKGHRVREGEGSERTEGQSPKISRSKPRVWRGDGQQAAELRMQTTEFKGMAPCQGPEEGGIVGYGRLGGVLDCPGAFPQGPFWSLKSLCPPPTFLSSPP